MTTFIAYPSVVSLADLPLLHKASQIGAQGVMGAPRTGAFLGFPTVSRHRDLHREVLRGPSEQFLKRFAVKNFHAKPRGAETDPLKQAQHSLNCVCIAPK